MQRLVADIKSRFSTFVIQGDHVAMILQATAEDSMPLMSMLESVEADQGSDFFWTFMDEYQDDESYAQAVVEAFSSKHQAVSLSLANEDLKPWPPIPASVTSTSTPPSERLRELAAFSRQLIPVENGGVCVWTFYPLNIADAGAYAALMQRVIEHDFPFPWCHHLRFIIREDPEEAVLEGLIAGQPRVDFYSPDLSREALNESIDEDYQDESLPLEQRMSSLLMSAGNDIGFERWSSALDKYALLLKYHGSMNNTAMGAVVLNNMGTVYERKGDEGRAEESYEAAMKLSANGEQENPQVMLNNILSHAEMRERQQRWEEAEGYWDSAQQLATVTRNGPLRIKALRRRGVCEREQEKLQEAESSWLGSTTIAAKLEDSDQCKESLEYLRDLYVHTGESGKEQAIRNYLSGFE